MSVLINSRTSKIVLSSALVKDSGGEYQSIGDYVWIEADTRLPRNAEMWLQPYRDKDGVHISLTMTIAGHPVTSLAYRYGPQWHVDDCLGFAEIVAGRRPEIKKGLDYAFSIPTSSGMVPFAASNSKQYLELLSRYTGERDDDVCPRVNEAFLFGASNDKGEFYYHAATVIAVMDGVFLTLEAYSGETKTRPYFRLYGKDMTFLQTWEPVYRSSNKYKGFAFGVFRLYQGAKGSSVSVETMSTKGLGDSELYDSLTRTKRQETEGSD